MNKEGRNEGKVDGVEGWTEKEGGRTAGGRGVSGWRDLKRIGREIEMNERIVKKERD